MTTPATRPASQAPAVAPQAAQAPALAGNVDGWKMGRTAVVSLAAGFVGSKVLSWIFGENSFFTMIGGLFAAVAGAFAYHQYGDRHVAALFDGSSPPTPAPSASSATPAVTAGPPVATPPGAVPATRAPAANRS